MSGNKTRQQPSGSKILFLKKNPHGIVHGLVQNLTVCLLPGKTILIICLNKEFF